MFEAAILVAAVVVWVGVELASLAVWLTGWRRQSKAAKDRGADRICRKCGYRIDNIPGPCCPECGRRFVHPDDFDPRTMSFGRRLDGREGSGGRKS